MVEKMDVSDELCDGDVGEILMEQEWKRLTETFSNSHDDNTVEEWTPPHPKNPKSLIIKCKAVSTALKIWTRLV